MPQDALYHRSWRQIKKATEVLRGQVCAICGWSWVTVRWGPQGIPACDVAQASWRNGAGSLRQSAMKGISSWQPVTLPL